VTRRTVLGSIVVVTIAIVGLTYVMSWESSG
jgi:hypothetical protein